MNKSIKRDAVSIRFFELFILTPSLSNNHTRSSFFWPCRGPFQNIKVKVSINTVTL